MRNKPIRIAFLDDEPVQLKIIQKHYEACKEKLGRDVEIDIFTDYKTLLNKFNHDIAVVDLDLKNPYVSGKDVGADLIKRHPDAQIMALTNSRPDTDNLAHIKKDNTNLFSEILDKYVYFKTHRALNKLSFLRLSTSIDHAFGR